MERWDETETASHPKGVARWAECSVAWWRLLRCLVISKTGRFYHKNAEQSSRDLAAVWRQVTRCCRSLAGSGSACGDWRAAVRRDLRHSRFRVGPKLSASPESRCTEILEGQGRSCDARLAVLFEMIVDNLDGELSAMFADLRGNHVASAEETAGERRPRESSQAAEA